MKHRLLRCTPLAALLVASTATADDDAPVEGEPPEIVESPQSIKLFDNRRTIPSFEIHAGPLWNRRVQDTTPITERRNFARGAPFANELGIGSAQTTPYGPFYLIGVTQTLFRSIDDKSFSWAVFSQEIGGGLMLGPFEPDARFRVGLLTADIVHAHPSMQLLSPGVSAGLAIHFGKLRIDARANADYLWRWFGADYVVRSLTIGIRLDVPRPRAPFPEH